MNTLSLQTDGLRHRYSSGAALHGLSLRVEEGSIYGFVGPNGAGKTTALRLVLGLLRRQEGAVSIFGKSLEKHRIEILRQVGSLIEGPSIYEHLTAAENLEIIQPIYGVSAARIAEVLELVGLAAANGKRAGQFSLGMKQRLAIAIAIIHHPRLLILDEPTNGLDPNGIVDMRDFLQRLNRERGTTIVISSHLLSEMERLATHLGVIHEGALLFQGTLEELRRARSGNARVWFGTSNNTLAQEVIQALRPSTELSSAAGDRICLRGVSQAEIARINQHLVRAGIDVHAIDTQENDLENIFMEMVKR